MRLGKRVTMAAAEYARLDDEDKQLWTCVCDMYLHIYIYIYYGSLAY